MISITMPTRNRPERLRKCIKSCVDLADNPGDLEFLLYVDEDDNETRHEELQSEFPATTIKTFVGKRLFNLYKVQNYLAECANGYILAYLADDMYFTTEGWDTRVKESFTDDQIWLVHPYEKYKGARGAPHGFLSKKAMEITGIFFPDIFAYNFGDTWMWDVYQSIGRCKCLDDVHISHDHPGFSERKKNPPLELAQYWDDTYREKYKISEDITYLEKDKQTYRKTLPERQEWISKLKQYIKNWSKRMDKDELIQFENDVKEIFVAGKIKAPVHLADGNESELIEIFKDIKRTDWVFSAWRSHYHALLHGIDPEWLKDQIEQGFSITICNPEHKFYTSAIVGGIIPIALGTALGLKIKGSSDHVWLFVGDMTSRTGAFHEALEYARGHSLPISFVIEDNGISVQTPTKESWGLDDTDVRVIRYEFKSSYPHVGAGKWVTF